MFGARVPLICLEPPGVLCLSGACLVPPWYQLDAWCLVGRCLVGAWSLIGAWLIPSICLAPVGRLPVAWLHPTGSQAFVWHEKASNGV